MGNWPIALAIPSAVPQPTEGMLIDQSLFLVGCSNWDSLRERLDQRVRSLSGLGRATAAGYLTEPFTGPRPLTSRDQTGGFSCGLRSLDSYLQTNALRDQRAGKARTFVIGRREDVTAYFTLAIGRVERRERQGGRHRQERTCSMSVILLPRLAVAGDWQSRGHGSALIAEALRCTVAAADVFRARALLVPYVNAIGRSFYSRYGFEVSPLSADQLMLSLKDIRGSLRT